MSVRSAAFDKFIKYALPALKGVGAYFAPGIFKGFMVEYLHHIGYKEVCTYVDQRISLWSELTPDEIGKIQHIIHELGDCPWLNTKWLIDAARSSKKIPLITSYFLSSKSAQDWLETQLLEFRGKLSSSV